LAHSHKINFSLFHILEVVNSYKLQAFSYKDLVAIGNQHP